MKPTISSLANVLLASEKAIRDCNITINYVRNLRYSHEETESVYIADISIGINTNVISTHTIEIENAEFWGLGLKALAGLEFATECDRANGLAIEAIREAMITEYIYKENEK